MFTVIHCEQGCRVGAEMSYRNHSHRLSGDSATCCAVAVRVNILDLARNPSLFSPKCTTLCLMWCSFCFVFYVTFCLVFQLYFFGSPREVWI
uniref:Uncharacterized protein n=1 Tax=Rhipicephalus zambeziensis TaxID=60191 RepID=A0A224Y958_9ACAR